ncbi:MAG: ABC transporter substrate-binding protein [Gammaproteobacteria bacterium]
MQRYFAWQRCLAAALALITLPMIAEAESRVVRLAFVHPQTPVTATRGLDAFWKRLKDLGYVEGQNLLVEARWGEGRAERLPALMNDVVARKVDVLVTYSTQGALAAKNATSTIPIVGVGMGEPLRTGLATNLPHPEGNLTGLSGGLAQGIAGKRLELLHEAVPRLATVTMIGNPGSPIAREMAKELQTMAPSRGLKLQFIEVREAGSLDRAFQEAKRRGQAALVLTDAMMSANIERVTVLAAKNRVPTMYYLRDFVDVGGLMAYAPDYSMQWRRAAEYVDKIVKGAKPAELPIEQPTQYFLVVNLKAARALGLKIPESILLRADEVIR